MTKYVCGVDYQHEFDHDPKCVHYYDSLEEIKEKSTCWHECGVVEVEFDGPGYPTKREDLKSVKWVVEQDFGRKK